MFLMDVWWNTHFSCSDLEPSNWNNMKQPWKNGCFKFRVPWCNRGHTVSIFCALLLEMAVADILLEAAAWRSQTASLPSQQFLRVEMASCDVWNFVSSESHRMELLINLLECLYLDLPDFQTLHWEKPCLCICVSMIRSAKARAHFDFVRCL